MASVRFLNFLITFFCLVGLGLSIYSYIVELSFEQDPKHQPFCDISESVSCSKAFTSEYGMGFGIFPKGSPLHKPNSLFGILFYSLVATLTQSNSRVITKVSYWAVFLSNLASLYFAYLLYFVIKSLCIICVSIYVVNALNLVVYSFKVQNVEREHQIESRKKQN